MPYPKKILVVNLAGMGDIILSSPAVKVLKAKFPQEEISLLTYEDHHPLVKDCPYFQKIFIFDKKLTLNNLRTISHLRKQHFDMVVNLYNIHSFFGSMKIFLLLCFINAKESVGRDTATRGFFYQHKYFESGSFEKHDTETMLEVVKMIGAIGSPTNLELWIKEEKEGIGRFFKENQIKENDRIICIHPGASRLNHRWPIQHFAQVADQLSKNYHAKIVITGSKKELGLAKQLSRLMTSPAIVSAGEFRLPDLVQCLKKSKLFITNDTGPMHIASVLRVPTVVVSGNSPKAFLPYQKENIIVLRKTFRRDFNNKECLDAITCEEVMGAAGVLLDHVTKEISKPVKILHLHTRAIVGGSGTNVLLTLAGLSKERFDSSLACGKDGAQPFFLEQITQHNISAHFLKNLVQPIHIVKDILALFEIMALIKKERFEIVHTHNSKAGILGRVAAKMCNVPVIVHTIHSCAFHYEGVGWAKKRLFLFLEKIAATFTDHFVAISEHLKEEFIKYHIAPAEKISVIYSGIELEKFKNQPEKRFNKKEFGFRTDHLVVGVVGRLEKGKGHEDVMKAIPQIVEHQVNTRFLFVGDGPMRSRLERMAESAHIGVHVVFAGLRMDVADILKSIDILCLASPYEGMGRVILEAQASGRPVVANRVGGIPNIVKDQETAILVDSKNKISLAEAILQLVTNAQLRRTMGIKGSQFVDERFSAKTMIQDIAALYETLLKEK